MSELLPSRAPYLGNVATRCFQNNNYQLAGAGRWQMSRSAHWARDRVANPTVILPGWRLNSNNEQSATGGTLKVSIEYPVGTFKLANECIAAASGPVAMTGGNNVFTFSGVDIPRGKKFFVRVLQQNANGVIYRQFQNNGTGSGPDPDDGWEIGTGTVADKTTSGTVASNILSYFPVAICSMTRRNSYLIFGDSRQEGGAELASDNTYDVGEVPRSLGRTHAYSNIAASATLLNLFLSGNAYTNRVALAPYFSHVVNAYGINDLNGGGRTVAQLTADRTTFANLFPNNTVVGCTLSPLSGSSDGWFTTANQTIGAQGILVQNFNEVVRKGIAGESFYWDISDGTDPYRTGKWPVTRDPGATTYGGTQAVFTASIANTGIMTVSTFTSGSPLKVGDWILSSLTGANPTSPSPCRIVSLGTGTGGAGTYQLDKLGMTVASTTMYTGGVATVDGLHGNLVASEMIRDSGVVRTDYGE